MRLRGTYHGENRLRYWRTTRKISQRALAKQVGVSQAFIWSLESGRRESASSKVAERIATALDRPLADLFDPPYMHQPRPSVGGGGAGEGGRESLGHH